MGGMDGGNDDGDMLFNQGATSDLDQQRAAIKSMKAVQDEIERKRIAAEEKAKRDR